MGNGMNRILDGVFVGSIRDSRDKEQITKFNITHILTIHEDPREGGLEVCIFINKFFFFFLLAFVFINN